ncbi:MAG: phosphate signaling complex protein PhoU [Rhodospirillaceae bacterium]|nr:phosphate signaling complex protein PhoU [Rhodospirillaceae bacterium]
MPHIVSSFDQKIARLEGTIERMGVLAASQLDRALDALERHDVDLARAIPPDDAEIDALHAQLDEQVILFLALRAPVAVDLRTAITALRIAGELERIADHARSIAKRVLALQDTPAHPPVQPLVRMGRTVHQLVVGVMEADKMRAPERALEIWHQDQAIDTQYSGAFRELLTYMMENTRLLAACSHMVFLAKDIERIGDHATNIGEMVYYRETGQTLDMARPKADTTAFPSAPAD